MDRQLVAKKMVELRNGRAREEVASACGISVSALAMYENGTRIPKDDIKIRIANYYGTTVESLFYATE